jgi:hypothetical protein
MKNRKELGLICRARKQKNTMSREGEKYHFHKEGGGDKYRFRTEIRTPAGTQVKNPDHLFISNF